MLSQLREDIRGKAESAGFSDASFIEMDGFPAQQAAMSNLDPELRIDWAIYPTKAATNDCCCIMVELVQGIDKRCPLLAVRLETGDIHNLYPAIQSALEYFKNIEPEAFVIHRKCG